MEHADADAAAALIDATLAMAQGGVPLMRRVLPAGCEQRLWDRYPPGDAVAPGGSRYFYHSHARAERTNDEHGHFHLFLPGSAMPTGAACFRAPPDPVAASHKAVHVVALAIDARGLPVRLFTTNRWVTDEWLFGADAIIGALSQFDLDGAPGDALVNRWLTAAIALTRSHIADLLVQRDVLLDRRDPTGEDRSVEIASSCAVDVQRLIDG